MGYGIKIRVSGDYALFTRPEMKVERVSYDIITPSAARGIIEAVYWKPAIRWVIDRIHVLKPIEFTNIRRNEVSEKASERKPYLVATEIHQQRAALVLKNVEYVIEAHFDLTDKAGETDTVEKHYNIILRRLRKGQQFHAPCLGTREFGAKVELIEDDESIPQSPLGDLELGWMLHDLDFSDSEDIKPQFFKASLKKRRVGFDEVRGGAAMILQALTKYYDILSNDPESDIAPPGYSAIGISFALNISAKGELLDVFPLFEQVQRGKKMEDKPRRMIVPEQVKRAVNISANCLWDNCVYVLGISDKEAKDPEYNIKRLEAFRQLNIDMLKKVGSPAAKAVISFLENYESGQGRKHPKISPHLETILKGGNLVFMFDGKFVHEDPAIRQAWEKYKGASDSELIQCLVTGETAPLARLHPSLKGIRDANPTGATLVGFNAHAYESYNREQGMNSPVSEKAAFAYTTALNYLLSSSNENKKFYIGDTTVIYWAESEKKEYAKAFLGLCEPEEVEIPTEEEAKPTRDKKAEKKLKNRAEKIRRVQALDTHKLLDGLDGNPRFYVLGLAPNAARVSVRFFHSDPFDKVVEKIMRHYKDLEIIKEFEDQHTYLTIQDILKETVSPKASDQSAAPLLAGSVFRAILENTPYPAALFNSIINRVRADQDEKFTKKVNYKRAAILKAYLLRKYRNQPQHPIQEVLVMSLNEQSTIPAYLLGRLFAVLEKVQQEAIGDMNASIKDRYFTSACASPKNCIPDSLATFATLDFKAEYGYASDNRIEKIMNLLDVDKNPFPAHLTLDEQGIFVLGYYHQRTAFFVKNNSSTETTETN